MSIELERQIREEEQQTQAEFDFAMPNLNYIEAQSMI